MKQIKIILILALLITTIGCAGASKKETETLKKELSSLKTTVGDLNWKLEELSNKFMLLQEQRAADRDDSLEEDDYEEEVYEKNSSQNKKTPPRNLKVVTLKKKLKKKPKQEIFIKREAKSANGLYREGQDLFLSGQYRAARTSFARLVENFPTSDLADNALYWGGEAYYSEELYKEALEIFIKVITEYGDGNKAPDAMLKVAYSYIELGNENKAKDSLEEVLKRYPESGAAIKAKKRLKSL